jgi:RimJ/RimL family protein N-acetyltransferase
VVIGVVAAASGRGIGAGLLRQARDWAARHGLHRLELTVMAHNRRAADLYKRMGFSVEGRRAECCSLTAGSSMSFKWPPSSLAGIPPIRPDKPVP